MNMTPFRFFGTDLHALPCGALYWPDHDLLVFSDLHLGKAARLSSVGGAQLPPYEARETLGRMAGALAALTPAQVICLGDSFDFDSAADGLPDQDRSTLTRLQQGRRWIWITGNHDAGHTPPGGEARDDITLGPLVFRHIAQPSAMGEVSGHYHPKARLRLRGCTLARPCFLWDTARLILPAYGSFTGGLCTQSRVLSALMAPEAKVLLTGSPALTLSMPRQLAG